jgi:hypothetical protein
MIITFLDIKGIVHFEFITQGQTVNQVYVEIPKQLCEAVYRKRPELWPNNWICHHDNALAQLKQFLAQKPITELEYSSCSPDLALIDFWLFPEIKSALMGWRFQDIQDIQKKEVMALKAI